MNRDSNPGLRVNEMKIKGLLTLALCALSVTAAAQFTTVAPAYEIALTNFRAPATQSGGGETHSFSAIVPISKWLLWRFHG